ncbi:MAG: AMP-binding protein [Spartobacteria bacterium]
MRQYPANPMQAAAYHRYCSAPKAPGAQVQVSISFGESVNSEFLHHAWQVVVQRHPILRSAFSKSIDGVVVREADKGDPHWISLDWQSVPKEEIPEKWNDLVAADALVEFEPISLPLVRFHEIRLPGGGGHYLLTTPAFLLDEFSITRVLLDLLLTLGQSPLAAPGNLPEPMPAKGWREFMEGAAAPMSFEPRFGDGAFVRSSLLLDRTGTSAFSKFCHDNDLEESLVIRCLWSLLLRRFGAGGNLMLCRFDGRGESTESGYFQNQLPLVQSWQGTVGDWLDAAQLLEDTEAENIWIEADEVLREAGLDFPAAEIETSFLWRGVSMNDIIHTALPRWINFDGQIQPVRPRGFSLEARPGPRLELTIAGPFSTEGAAKQILSRLAFLINGLAGSAAKPVSRLPVLLPEEIQTLRQWSHGPAQPAHSGTVIDAIRRHATDSPDRIAVRCGDYAMTYEELDAMSDKLAAHLQKTGVSGGWHAAVVLSPSAWIAVATLGIWKAGNSCLAVDPAASADWIEQTLSSHDVALVLCDSSSAPHIDASHRRRIVIDLEWETLEEDSENPSNPAADVLAASIGGQQDTPPPQIRALTHGMLLSATLEAARLLNFRAGDVFLVKSAAGGGAFFDEWLIPFVAGGTAFVFQGDSREYAAAPVTHLRLTAPEWANHATAWLNGGVAFSETIRSVAIEAGNPLLNGALIWARRYQNQIKQTIFYSPAGLCGLGFAGGVRKDTPRLPVGKPAAEVEISLVDGDSLEIPSGFLGKVHFKVPGWRTLPDAEGRLGLDLGINGWRDGQGDLFIERGEHQNPSIPAHDQILAAMPFEKNVVDINVGSSIFVLSNEEVPGAISLPEWPLNRAGWIDESALPQSSAEPAIDSAPKTPSTPSPRRTSSAESWTPLVSLQNGSPDRPLILVHGLNGSPEIYRELVEAFGPGRRILGITARGLANPEACHPNIETAAAQYLAAIAEEEPSSNYQLAGFGFGAALVLEMARQLQSVRRTLPELVLIGCIPPQPKQQDGWLNRLKKSFKRSKGPVQIEPQNPENETAARHEALWHNYRFPISEFPAKMILPSNIGEGIAEDWLELLPYAEVEFTRSFWADMLARPAVKRVASILNTVPAAEVSED